MNDKIQDLVSTLEIINHNLLDRDNSISMSDTGFIYYYEYCKNLIGELINMCDEGIKNSDYLRKHGLFNYKNVVTASLNDEILSKYTELTSEKDFDERIVAEDILLKMREELVQKSYEEELETIERSHKQRIIEINDEFFQNITEKIIEVEVIKKVLNDESIETFNSPVYKSPLIDQTPIKGIAAPLPENGPHVVYRLPEYNIFDHFFKIKTSLYHNEIQKNLQPRFDNSYFDLKKRFENS